MVTYKISITRYGVLVNSEISIYRVLERSPFMQEQITDVLLKNILDIIRKHGISEKDCLVNANLSSSYFSDWKAGRLKSPTIDKVFRISQVLGVSIDSLLGISQSQNEASAESKYSTQNELAPDEDVLLNTYRDMTSQGKKLLRSEEHTSELQSH